MVTSMYYQSQFESSARHSQAISILNNFRHYLTGRKKEPLPQAWQQICHRAVELERPAVVSNGHVYDGDGFSPTLELSSALHGAASSLHFDDETKKHTFARLKALLNGSQPNPEECMHQILVSLVERSMDSITDQSVMENAR